MKTRNDSLPEVDTGAIGTNVVIFTLRDRCLYLLLVNRANNTAQPEWALPGGPLRLGEDIEQSARQQLAQKAGVTGVYLEQLYTLSGGQHRFEHWDITVAHFALFPAHELSVRQTNNGDAIGWFQLDQLPHLQGNDRQIVTMAHARLAAKLEYSTIALQFLPEQFTLRELQEVYETILDQAFDKRNFVKSVLANNFIEETGEKHMNGAHRPARLYRVKCPGKVEFTKWSVTKKELARRAL